MAAPPNKLFSVVSFQNLMYISISVSKSIAMIKSILIPVIDTNEDTEMY